MTSEYPDFVFVVYDGDTSDQTYDITVSCEAGTLVGKPVKYIRHDLNTSAAPDVPEFDVNQSTTKGVECHKPQSVALKHDVPELVRYDKEFESMFEREDGKYVLHSQAAEIIAADRAEKHRAQEAVLKLERELAQYEVQKPFGYVVERHSLSVDFQYEPLTSGEIESGIKATAVYVSPAPSADVKAKIEEYFAAKTAYDDAVKPNGAFGQPKILRHHNPIVQRYVAATAALKEVAH